MCVEYIGTYGSDGLLCVDCPIGGHCEGFLSPPRSLKYWYRLDHPVEEGRFLFQQCIPREACLGDNLCSIG